jgi:V8-like Glu-specific endopeptidase
MIRITLATFLLAFSPLAALAPRAAAADLDSLNSRPTALEYPAAAADALDTIAVPPVDVGWLQADDAVREALGEPPRFADTWEVFITPGTHGTWEALDEKTQLWHLRITSTGALSLNLGFTRYSLPHNAKLFVYATDFSDVLGPYTEADNAAHNQLWTPVVLADDIVVELTVPSESVDDVQLELTAINHGYRFFGEPLATRAGSCNVDVICPEGDPWRAEIRAVGVISTGGSTFCTGFMVNNTAENQTPYFMTANHCGITSSNAASLVVYWNFESPVCGQQGGGSLSQNQTGSFWRAGSSSYADFTLVELDSAPNPAHHVTFAGWNKGGAEATTAVAIHHPNTDEKSISFEFQSTQTTSYLGTSVPGDGTHHRVIDWDIGTTEPGSSGSPLFNQDHQVIGQLHGGYAACGNDLSDWYGKFARSWTGGGTNTTRLSNWLDAGGTGATFVDTLDPEAGLGVTPYSGLDASGDPGGPFTPSSIVYTLENQADYPINYAIGKKAAWVTIDNAGGSLAPGATATLTVSINAAADSLPIGEYSDTVTLTNTTDGRGSTTRVVNLQVGGPSLIYSWNMDTNPGWTAQTQWAWGDPTGQGGQYGNPDPQNGHTGTNVYGYNLAGDYANNLAEKYLTTPALDCTGLTGTRLRFWRWLNVEQPTYDHARLRISTNGSTWTTIWENGSEITDSSWTQVEYDISAIADGQATVYLRWVMGTTDGSWQYSGWNIDDVEIWAYPPIPDIPGDLDGDGDVDLADLSQLLTAFGACTGDPGYDAAADIDGSGCVDLADLSALLTNYGA